MEFKNYDYDLKDELQILKNCGQDSLYKFLLYKYNAASNDNPFDCDRCEYAKKVYDHLWGFDSSSTNNFALISYGHCKLTMGMDTINSFWTTFASVYLPKTPESSFALKKIGDFFANIWDFCYYDLLFALYTIKVWVTRLFIALIIVFCVVAIFDGVQTALYAVLCTVIGVIAFPIVKFLYKRIVDFRSRAHQTKCPFCKKRFAVKEIKTYEISRLEKMVLVTTKRRNSDGDVVGTSEQYVPGWEVTYRTDMQCTKCNSDMYTTSVEKIANI